MSQCEPCREELIALFTWLLTNLPHIKRNGHQSVQHDDVGPEGQEGGERTINPSVTREEDCEHWTLPHLPDCIANGQNRTHGRQDTKDLIDRHHTCWWFKTYSIDNIDQLRNVCAFNDSNGALSNQWLLVMCAISEGVTSGFSCVWDIDTIVLQLKY